MLGCQVALEATAAAEAAATAAKSATAAETTTGSAASAIGTIVAAAHAATRRSVERAHALATTASSFRFLLALLHRRLEVVPTTLKLAKDAFGGHLPLEVLHGAIESAVTDHNFDLLTLNCFTDHSRVPLAKSETDISVGETPEVKSGGKCHVIGNHATFGHS